MLGVTRQPRIARRVEAPGPLVTDATPGERRSRHAMRAVAEHLDGGEPGATSRGVHLTVAMASS